MQDKVDILTVKVDRVTMDEATGILCGFFRQDETKMVFTPNSEIILNAYKNPDFAKVLNSADLLVPDGIGVVKAAKILKKPISERVAGFDLIGSVFEKIKISDYTVFLLGSKPGVAESAKAAMEEKFKGIKIVGCENGYFTDDGPVLEKINAAKPDFLLVCLGSPRQEEWIYKNRDKLCCKVAIGAGGSLDVFAGTAKRAPEFFIKCNIEWLYRLLCQPSRFWRMLSLPKFALTVLFKGKRQGGEKLQ